MYEALHVFPGQLVEFTGGRKGDEPYLKQGVFVGYGRNPKLVKVRRSDGVVQWVKIRNLRPLSK